MDKHEISKFQLELLVKSIDVVPDYIKSGFLKSFNKFLLTKTLDEKKYTVRAAYNVFNLLSVVGSKELFLNGRIIFTQDMGKIFRYLAEDYSVEDSVNLFPGCDISVDQTNSYLCLNMSILITRSGNLKFSSMGSIALPVETLTINTKYNNSLITKLKELLI